MANAVTHATAVRTDLANLVIGNSTTWGAGPNQKLILYTGTMPANAAASLSGNTAASTITGISWGAASAGVTAIAGSTADTNAVGGAVTFFRLTKSDGTTVILQGTVGTSACDLNINNTTIPAGANVSLSGTYTAAA
jgi:hypothetical protein